MADDFFRNASQQSAFDSATSVTTDDDEVGLPLLGGIDDLRRRLTGLDKFESLQVAGQMSTKDGQQLFWHRCGGERQLIAEMPLSGAKSLFGSTT